MNRRQHDNRHVLRTPRHSWLPPTLALLALLFATGLAADSASAQTAVAHDVNGDGIADIRDAQKVLRLAVGTESPGTQAQALAADADGDGQITTLDALSILRMHVGIVPKLTVTASAVYGGAPLEVTFTATVEGGEAPHVVSWDFTGDGVADATGASAVHTFAADATYPVSAWVADNVGATARLTLPVTVHSAVPAVADGIEVRAGDGYIHLSWPHALLADDVAGYNIYRQAPGEVEFTKLNTWPLAEHYWDRRLSNAQVYSYYLRAVGLNGLEGPAGDPVTATPGPLAPAPRLLEVTPGDGQAELAWTPVAGATGYRIYRFVGRLGMWPQPSPAAPVAGTTVLCDNLENGVITGFFVRAIVDGCEGAASNAFQTVPFSSLDSDEDGMPDDWERAYGLDPYEPTDADEDPDGDGVTNLDEFLAGTDPTTADTDGDGLGDGFEVATAGFNPLLWDTSGGGEADGLKYADGRDPADPATDVPQPPEGFAVFLDDDLLGFHWLPATTPDIDGYNLYRNAMDGQGLVKLNTAPIATCSMAAVPVLADRLQNFVVTTVKAAQESEPSRNIILTGKLVDGAVGGTITLFTDSLDIPPGAFVGNRWIAMAQEAALSYFAATGRRLTLLPHGLVFDVPATLKRNLDHAPAAQALWPILTNSLAQGETARLVLSSDLQGTQLVSSLPHFCTVNESIAAKQKVADIRLTQDDDLLIVRIESSGIKNDEWREFMSAVAEGAHKLSGGTGTWMTPEIYCDSSGEWGQSSLEGKSPNTGLARTMTVKLGDRKLQVEEAMRVRQFGPRLVDGTYVYDYEFVVERVLVDEDRGTRLTSSETTLSAQYEGDFTQFADRAYQSFFNCEIRYKVEDLDLAAGDVLTVKAKMGGGFYDVTEKYSVQETESVPKPFPLGPTRTAIVPSSVAVQDEPYALGPWSLFTPAQGKSHADYTVSVESGPFQHRYPNPIRADQWITWTPLDSSTPEASDVAYYDRSWFLGWLNPILGRSLHRRRPSLRIQDNEGSRLDVEWDLTVLNRPDPPALLSRTPASSLGSMIQVYRTRSVNLEAVFVDHDISPEDAGLQSGQTYDGSSVIWSTAEGSLSGKTVSHDRSQSRASAGATYTAPDAVTDEYLTVDVFDTAADRSERAEFFVSVRTPPAPTLSVSGPSSLYTGQSGTYSAYVSDGQSWKTYATGSFSWGNASRGSYFSSGKYCTASFSRSQAGTYTITCTVTDQFGQTASASKTVSVASPPAAPPPEGDGAGNVIVNSQQVTIRVWDNAAEDGDRIDLFLNGAKLLDNHTLTNAGRSLNVWLPRGHNTLKVLALNTGSSGPNTASVSISNVTSGSGTQTWNANQGAYSQCTITVPFY